MTAVSIIRRRDDTTPRARSSVGLQQLLLCCGILSTLLYAAMNVFLATQTPGYSSLSQTISELSAVGAQTRSLWMIPGFAYTILAIAFGCGVLRIADEDRRLRVAGFSLLSFGALGLLWPFAPMHERAVLAAGGGSLTDTAHIALGIASVATMLVAIAYGGTALGRSFRLYSVATLAAVLVFGTATGMNAPRISANLPTRWLGLWERISIAAFLFWEVVFALSLMRRQRRLNA